MKKAAKPGKKNKQHAQVKNPFNMKGGANTKGQNIIKRAARGR